MLRNLPTALPLRIGCAFVNLYAGFYLVTDPARYHKFVPEWLKAIANSVASVDAYLRLQGIGELLIAATLLAWFAPKWAVRTASIMLAVEMTLIMLFIGVDSVTFRNAGLLGASLALLIDSFQESEVSEGRRETVRLRGTESYSIGRG